MITTSKSAKKTRNLRNKPAVDFSIDDENLPYRRVKGKGFVAIVEDPDRVLPQADRISMSDLILYIRAVYGNGALLTSQDNTYS